MFRTSPTSGCCRKTFSSASAARTWPVPALAERIRTLRPLGLGDGLILSESFLVRRNRFLKSVIPLAKELSLFFALGMSTIRDGRSYLKISQRLVAKPELRL